MLRAAVVVGIVCILSTLNFLIWASSQEITLDIVGFQEFQLIENILYCDITFEVINPNIQSIKINPFQLNFRLCREILTDCFFLKKKLHILLQYTLFDFDF